jgi:hypothetical protein
MNRGGFVRYHWSNEDNKIVHVTETITGVGALTAHVNLNDDSVEIIETKFIKPSIIVTPDDQNRIFQGARDWDRRQRPYPKDIRWHEDGMEFETQRESWEWASSVVYNEIGNLYDGYRTEDEKIACSLVYELTRLNTFKGPTFYVFAHNNYNHTGQKTCYMVWVERVIK